MSIAKTLRFVTGHPLNRGNTVGCLARFVRWQVRSRLAPGDVVCEWVNGSRFLARTGETGLTGNIYTGLVEFGEMAFVLHVLREGDVFVDVGSNVGAYTILACAAAGASGYAFEPVPGAYERLVGNVRLNDLDARVTCLNQAASDAPGAIEFTTDHGTRNRALAPGERGGDTVSVEVTTLDAALAGAAPTLLKIDVEGYEAPVLRGAAKTLAAPTLRAVIIEVHRSASLYGYELSEVTETMDRHGFRAFDYDPLGRKLSERSEPIASYDKVLYVRDEAFMRDRVAGAPKVRLLDKEF